MTYQPPSGPPQQPPYPPYQSQPKRKRHIGRKILITIGGIVVAIIVTTVIVAIAGAGSKTTAAGTAPPAASQAARPEGGKSATAAPAPAAPQYTASQQQAIDSAESYLSDGDGFSKAGLISQLDSPDGEGFSVSLATFAVDHVSVNWRKQAVISAKSYMSDGEGFSYSGLVQQLNSPDGGQFTYAQSVYAAKKVGLAS